MPRLRHQLLVACRNYDLQLPLPLQPFVCLQLLVPLQPFVPLHLLVCLHLLCSDLQLFVCLQLLVPLQVLVPLHLFVCLQLLVPLQPFFANLIKESVLPGLLF